MIRRWHLVVLTLLALLALACEGGNAGSGPTSAPENGYPSSMAAIGDSITAGLGSCGTYVVCTRNSWSTGSGDAVDSHYRRILAKNAKIKGNARNFAEPGAEADALDGQAARAVKAKAQYVTVLIGANDACAKSVAGMTSVATFRSRVDSALNRLKRGLPKARILVASIPDLYRLWELGKSNPDAVRVWTRATICPSMFANPASTADADEQRRRQVRDRIDDYDDQLRQACKAYGKRCRWDNGSAHGHRFRLDEVSSVDYFHPNAKGQNELADATYRASW
jgi:lysophospholipase L1-like esterase